MREAAWFVLGGMAVVFAVLAILLGVVMALNRLPGPKADAKGPGAS